MIGPMGRGGDTGVVRQDPHPAADRERFVGRLPGRRRDQSMLLMDVGDVEAVERPRVVRAAYQTVADMRQERPGTDVLGQGQRARVD